MSADERSNSDNAGWDNYFGSLNEWVEGLVTDSSQIPFISSPKYLSRLLGVLPPSWGLGSKQQLKAVGLLEEDDLGRNNAFMHVIETEITPEVIATSRYYVDMYWKNRDQLVTQSPETDEAYETSPHHPSRLEDLSFAEEDGSSAGGEDLHQLLKDVYLKGEEETEDYSGRDLVLDVASADIEDEELEELEKKLREKQKRDLDAEEASSFAVEEKSIEEIVQAALQESQEEMNDGISPWLKNCLAEKFKEDFQGQPEHHLFNPEDEDIQVIEEKLPEEEYEFSEGTEPSESDWEPLGPNEGPSLDDMDMLWPETISVEEVSKEQCNTENESLEDVAFSMRNMTLEQMRFMQGYLEMVEALDHELPKEVGLSMSEILAASEHVEFVKDKVIVRRGNDDVPLVTRIESRLRDIFKKKVLVLMVDKRTKGGHDGNQKEGYSQCKEVEREGKIKNEKVKNQPESIGSGSAQKFESNSSSSKKLNERLSRNKSKFNSKRKDTQKRCPKFD